MLILNKEQLMKMGMVISKEMKNAPEGTLANSLALFIQALPKSISEVNEMVKNIKEMQVKKAPQQQQAPLPQRFTDNIPDFTGTGQPQAPQTQQSNLGNIGIDKLEDVIRYEFNGLFITAENQKEMLSAMSGYDLIVLLGTQKEHIIQELVKRIRNI